MTNTTRLTLSAEDRVSLSYEEKWRIGRRLAASMALRWASGSPLAYDLYLAGLMALPGIIAADPQHSMGFAHAISWPLRQAITRAAVEMCHTPPRTDLPPTLRRVIDTGHLL